MAKINKAHIFLLLTLVAGAALRLWGIDFGLPYLFHQDEPIVVNHALAYGTGDFNPHFFIIPPLTSYILFIIYGLYFAALFITGAITSIETFALHFFQDPSPFYLIGRFFIGFVPSMINIYLVYRLACRFFSKESALTAALIMSLSFLNVVNAHYIYTDNLLTTFVLAAYLAISNLFEKSAVRIYIISGLLLGIAVAVKYNAALLIFPFLTAHLVSAKRASGRFFNRNLIFFSTSAFIAFFVCNPFSLIDWRFFLMSMFERVRHGYTGLSHHLLYSLFEGMGSGLVISGIAGLTLCIVKMRWKGIFLLSFPFIFYMHLIFASQPFTRYALAIVPFLSIGAGILLFDIIRLKGRSYAFLFIASAAFLILMLPTTLKSIKAGMLFMSKDTRAEAAEWIEKNVPARSKIAIDHTFFGPQLLQTKEQIREKEEILNRQPELAGLKKRKMGLQYMVAMGKDGYEVYYIVGHYENTGQFLKFWPVILADMKLIKASGIKYAVFNNMELSDQMRNFQDAIAAGSTPIAEFNPYYEKGFRWPYDEIETTCLPIGSRELFSRRAMGPYIRIYRLP